MFFLSRVTAIHRREPSANMSGTIAVLVLCSTFVAVASLPTVDLGYEIHQATLNVGFNFTSKYS